MVFRAFSSRGVCRFSVQSIRFTSNARNANGELEYLSAFHATADVLPLGQCRTILRHGEHPEAIDLDVSFRGKREPGRFTFRTADQCREKQSHSYHLVEPGLSPAAWSAKQLKGRETRDIFLY